MAERFFFCQYLRTWVEKAGCGLNRSFFMNSGVDSPELHELDTENRSAELFFRSWIRLHNPAAGQKDQIYKERKDLLTFDKTVTDRYVQQVNTDWSVLQLCFAAYWKDQLQLRTSAESESGCQDSDQTDCLLSAAQSGKASVKDKTSNQWFGECVSESLHRKLLMSFPAEQTRKPESAIQRIRLPSDQSFDAGLMVNRTFEQWFRWILKRVFTKPAFPGWLKRVLIRYSDAFCPDFRDQTEYSSGSALIFFNMMP